jgi:molybdopterin converting factor small subunit
VTPRPPSDILPAVLTASIAQTSPTAPTAVTAVTTRNVTIRVPTPLRERCDGEAELPSGAASVRAALAELERRHPRLHSGICDETGAVRRHVNLFVNTSHVRDRDGLDTPLAPGDVLTILPAVSGG